jgi:hypothetical protein
MRRVMKVMRQLWCRVRGVLSKCGGKVQLVGSAGSQRRCRWHE